MGNQMVDIKRVTDTYSVAPQIDIDDFKAIKDAGFAFVINNRPDGETFGQLESAQAADKANEFDLKYAAVPIAGPQDLLESCDALNAAIDEAEGPILAYCRSGTRSVTLWSLASVKAGRETPESAIEKARNAGYDLSHLKDMMAQIKSS
jgi:uncharacterized protein (TIGR01244 family)